MEIKMAFRMIFVLKMFVFVLISNCRLLACFKKSKHDTFMLPKIQVFQETCSKTVFKNMISHFSIIFIFVSSILESDSCSSTKIGPNALFRKYFQK